MFMIVNKLQATKLCIQQLSGLNMYNERFFSVFIMQVLKIESSCSIRSKIAFLAETLMSLITLTADFQQMLIWSYHLKNDLGEKKPKMFCV